MFNRILTLPLDQQTSIFLFGPRGTGKTWWIKEHLLKNNPDTTLYLDLLDFALYSNLSANPNRLESLIPAAFTGWIVIDEVQKVPELLNEVHRLIEHRQFRFLLTGSSARSLRRKGVNLLAGRALTYAMHPLTIQELGDNFNLTQAINFGLLPKIINNPDPSNYLHSYVQTYLREEVLQEGLTRNIGSFNQFLEVASFSQGQLLNFSEIARELSINRLVVANYFDILEDLLIAIRIPSFNIRAKRKVIAHQKFYFFDTGVYRTVRPRGPLYTQAETEGPLLETLFLEALRAINDYYKLGYTIYFWRTIQGHEIDFVLYGERGFHAFEIKRSDQITSNSLKGLQFFAQEYPEAKLHIIYGGNRKEYHGNITAIPFEQALRELPEMLK